MSDQLDQPRNQKRFKDVKVVREGETIKLPERMTYDEGIEWLNKRKQEAETVVSVREHLDGFPLDCAHALQLACQQRYGFRDLKAIPGGFFRPDTPPTFVNTPIDHLGNTVEVFIGRFGVPNLDKRSYLQSAPDGFDGLHVIGQVRQKEMPEIKKLVELARDLLVTNSLYKGKAIKLEWKEEVSWMGSEEGFDTPTFMPPKPAGIRLLVNEETESLIKASVYTPITQTERCIELGIPLKRAIVCEGPYGCGKTLLAATVADLAPEHGWTFFYLTDIKHLKDAYRLTARYGRVVLFGEDIDQAMQVNEGHDIQNVLDGIDTKGVEVILIMTTNHAEKLDTSLLRHGRVETVIPFRPPDSDTAKELVEYYAGKLLVKGTDLTTIGETLNGLRPASIRSIVEDAKLFALSESEGATIALDEVSLLRAADAMKHHLKLLVDNMPKPKDSFAEQFGGAFGDQVGKWMVWGMNKSMESPEVFDKGSNARMLANIESNMTKRS